MIRDNFVAKDADGFYSLGGFVHLSDLAESTNTSESTMLTDGIHTAYE